MAVEVDDRRLQQLAGFLEDRFVRIAAVIDLPGQRRLLEQLAAGKFDDVLDVVMLIVPLIIDAPGEFADEHRCAALAEEQKREGGAADGAAVEAAAVPGAIVLLLLDEELAALAIPVAVGEEA